MRITIVVPSLGCGGTERIVTMMANYWATQGKFITVLTCDNEDTKPFYPLEKNVTYHALNILAASKTYFAGLVNNLRRIVILRNAIKQSAPDVLISFLVKNNVRVLLATRGLKFPIIVSERSDPAIAVPTRIWKFLIEWTYAWADRITVFTRHARASFSVTLQPKIQIIPNPITAQHTAISSGTDKNSLVGVGRLEEEKGFDLLLQAFALVIEKVPDTTLTIWGEGSQKSNLQWLSNKLKISDRVYFLGVTQDIYQALSQATIFVQASRCEGFGNALCEAMAIGLPVISTACSGPQEIIRHDYDGLLVPVDEVNTLAAAIIDLLSNEQKRKRLANAAPEITQRFSLTSIMNQWDSLIAEVDLVRK